MRPLFWGKNAYGRRKLWSLNFSAHGTGGDLNLGVVAEAFVFARVTASHHVEFAVILTEPYRRGHPCAILTKGGETNVFLAMDLGWDGVVHGGILLGIHKSLC